MTTTATTQTTSIPEQKPATRSYARKLCFYHANGGNSGVAMQLEMRLNRKDEDRYDCFFLELTPQKTAAIRDGEKTVPASFDWEKKLTVKLDFTDICELLTVLEGSAEKAGGQRNGLYHQNGKSSTVINLQKNTEKGGYFIGLSKKSKEGGDAVRLNMALSESEATGIRAVFQSALFFLTFHRTLFAAE